MACLPWFKVFVGVPDHRKVTRLMALLDNPLADAYVVRLWNHCAAHVPAGVFAADSAVFEIEHAVRWTGERGRLFDAFVAAELLDVHEDTVEVHDWKVEQGAHVAKAAVDGKKPDGRKVPKSQRKRKLPPDIVESSHKIPRDIVEEVSRESGGQSREKRVEKKESQVREAQETTSRVREDESPGQPPQSRGGQRSPPPLAPRAQPAWMQANTEQSGEPLPDGVLRVFREAKGAEYSWRSGRDDPASRELLALAGPGGTAEVLRRWGHGVRARYKQRCDNLAELLQRWEANATPEDGGATGPPSRRASIAPAPASKPEDEPTPW